MSVQRFFKTALKIYLGGFLLLSASGGWAGPTQVDQAMPLSITSKSMIAKDIDRMVIFEGDVVLNKGEFTLTADRLEVTLNPGDQGSGPSGKGDAILSDLSKGKEAISLIEAIGNVQVTQGNRHGKAEHAIYDQKEEKVVLTGQPEVWEQDYRVSGRRMIFFLREQKNVVEDSKAVVYPK